MTVRVTAAIRKQQMDNIRKQDDRVEEATQQLNHLRRMQLQNTADERVLDLRLLKADGQILREQFTHDSLLRAERDRILKDARVEQEEKLSQELERRKLEALKDEKMRQQIRENSPELRELELKIKEGYANKERAAQIAEKIALKLDEKRREELIALRMKEQRESAETAEAERERERYKEHVRYQQELERQLEEQELRRQKAYEEQLGEKLMVDEIVRKMYEEDQAEIEKAKKQKVTTQEYVNSFLKAREDWKEKERDKMEEENRKIRDYETLQKQRDHVIAVARKEKREAMDRLQEELQRDIVRRDAKRVEMENTCLELYLEEEEARRIAKDKEEIEKKKQSKLDMQQQHEKEMEFKELRKQAEKDEEEQYRQQMLAKFAEDDRIEQMNAMKRRIKQAEHRKAVEDLLEQRRAQYAQEQEQEIAERKEQLRMEEFRKQIVEEERQKLLKAHATQLVGYLPPGVIEKESDLDMLGPEFKQAFTRRPLDPFDEFAWDHPR